MTVTSKSSSRSDVRPFVFGWRVGTFRGRLWSWSWILWTSFFLLPLLSGWFLKLIFDRLSTDQSINGLLIAIGVTEVVRWVVFAAAVWVVVRWWVAGLTLMRTNMLFAQTVSGGRRAARLPASPAEAISRFNEDARDTVLWADSWLDGSGAVILAAVALIVMSTINLAAALVAIVPLISVAAVTRLLTPRLYAARAADRAATGQVTSFLGETFAGLLAFRLAGREEAALIRLDQHTALRRRTAVRDTVLQQTIDAISSSTTDITIGLTLLVLVPSVRSGDLSIGELALFVAYAVELGVVPRFVARLISAREQAKVSMQRMGELVASDQIDDLFEECEVTIEAGEVMRTREPDPQRETLQRLEVRNLTSVYESTGGGIRDASFDIERGSFTVVTGAVGAGKTTLLRAIVGLAETEAGTISWNGALVSDVAAWFVPPNAAHLPQVPCLFSESLEDNIAMGRDLGRLTTVLDQTTLTQDLGEMPGGASTVVGSRGLRLSGGQLQRVAAARCLLTEPELLVVDDLSSALDVATERDLWARLQVSGTSTVIAVSHRQFVIDQADQVITIGDGRIVAVSS